MDKTKPEGGKNLSSREGFNSLICVSNTPMHLFLHCKMQILQYNVDIFLLVDPSLHGELDGNANLYVFKVFWGSAALSWETRS